MKMLWRHWGSFIHPFLYHHSTNKYWWLLWCQDAGRWSTKVRHGSSSREALSALGLCGRLSGTNNAHLCAILASQTWMLWTLQHSEGEVHSHKTWYKWQKNKICWDKLYQKMFYKIWAIWNGTMGRNIKRPYGPRCLGNSGSKKLNCFSTVGFPSVWKQAPWFCSRES